jgi:hypothetical protein
VNASGELPDNAAFQAVIDKAGLLDQLLDEVKGALESFTQSEGEQEQRTGLDAISTEDFPLGRVQIETSGEFTYTDPDGTVVKGAVENTNLMPEPTRSAAPTTAPEASAVPSSRPRRGSNVEPEPSPSPAAAGAIEVITTQPAASGAIYIRSRPGS